MDGPLLTEATPEPMAAAAPPTPEASASPPRDVRIDLLRGLCVAMMIFGHTGWRRFDQHLPIGWTGAGDAFFLLSGATLGIVAKRAERKGKLAAFTGRLGWRALWLYAVNLLLVVLAYVFVVNPAFSPERAARRMGRTPFWLGVLKFDQPLALNVLPRYTVFLALTPLLLAAIRTRAGAWATAVGSFALWGAFQLRPQSVLLPFFEIPGADFPVATYQLLFVVGLLIAFRWGDRPRRLSPAWRTALMVFATLGMAAFVRAQQLTPGRAMRPPDWLRPWVDRELLGPLRLVNLVFVALFFWLLFDRFRPAIARATGWLLEPLGQNALSAFLLHLPFLWLTLAWRPAPELEWLRKASALGLLVALSLLVRNRWVRKLLAPV